MKALFLNSKLDLCDKTEDGQRIPHHFGNKNRILTNLKKYIKSYNHMLLIASDADNIEEGLIHAQYIIESFNLTLPFKKYTLLDSSNKAEAQKLVQSADLIYIMGGHVPTQNKFINEINLKDILRDYDGVIIGTSAGCMNSAEIVYSPPELEGEGYDKNFQRFLHGLGLTKINIFPHYDKVKDDMLDGRRLIDYAIDDSKKIPILLLNNTSYVVQVDGKMKLYGKAFKLYQKKIVPLCENGRRVEINNKLDVL